MEKLQILEDTFNLLYIDKKSGKEIEDKFNTLFITAKLLDYTIDRKVFNHANRKIISIKCGNLDKFKAMYISFIICHDKNKIKGIELRYCKNYKLVANNYFYFKGSEVDISCSIDQFIRYL